MVDGLLMVNLLGVAAAFYLEVKDDQLIQPHIFGVLRPCQNWQFTFSKQLIDGVFAASL